MTDKKSKKLIVVLGMHRSGTSVITRALEVMGVYLGNRLLPPMKDVNEKGFWEDIDINALNIEMLETLHLTWHHLVPITMQDIEILRTKGFVTRAVELLHQKIENVPVFAFKDPSVAKLLPFWQEALRQCHCEVNFVVAIRHPLSVVQSLAKRDGFDDEKSYSLWLGYVIASLCCLSDGNKSVFVDYDRVMQSPDSELNRIAQYLQLTINPAALTIYQSEFLDKKLRHTTYSTKDVLNQESCPTLVSDIYTVLLDAATDTISINDPALQGQIRQWEKELKNFNPLFTLADRLYLQKTDAIAERDKNLNKYNQEASKYNQVVSKYNQEVSKYNQVVIERDAVIVDINRVIKGFREHIDSLDQIVKDQREYITDLIKENANKELIINQVFSSQSWRLTSPLRKIKPLLKKIWARS